MNIRTLTSPHDLRTYQAWLSTHPDGSLWQSLEWKQFQESLGREVRIYAALRDEQILASALVVIDRTSMGLSTWEVARGPLLNMEYRMLNVEFLETIITYARRERCMNLYFSPQKVIPYSTFNIQHSGRHVHPQATRILDLRLSDEDLLAQMKPKGRYNIRLAEKHGVRVELSDDVTAFAALAKETARRDGFRGHSEDFYRKFLTDLPGSFLLLAYREKKPMTRQSSHSDFCEGSTEERAEEVCWTEQKPNGEDGREKPISGLLGVICGKTGLYYYGASGNAHRELMAPYLLQWEAMKHCKAHGCTSYDLFGIAPEGRDDHPWNSVSDFKAKFGGSVVTYPPEQEIVLRPLMNKALSWKRKILG